MIAGTKCIKLNEEEVKWLNNNYSRYFFFEEFKNDFNAKFNKDFKLIAFQAKCRRLGIYLGKNYTSLVSKEQLNWLKLNARRYNNIEDLKVALSANISSDQLQRLITNKHIAFTYYTKEELEWLKTQNNLSWEETTVKFNEKFNRNKTPQNLISQYHKMGCKKNNDGKFKKGFLAGGVEARKIGVTSSCMTKDRGIRYRVKFGDSGKDYAWIPEDVYKANIEIENVALAYGLVNKTKKQLKELKNNDN